MGCSHCMINAGPNGKHMSMETYNDVLKFIEKIGLPVILLYGGEPTRRPEILSIIDVAKEKKFISY